MKYVLARYPNLNAALKEAYPDFLHEPKSFPTTREFFHCLAATTMY